MIRAGHTYFKCVGTILLARGAKGNLTNANMNTCYFNTLHEMNDTNAVYLQPPYSMSPE